VPANSKPVIVNADDFALSEGVSLAIARLAGLGRVSATSVMVLSPRWPGDVALLRPLRGRIDVGLHLDWTSAFAVAAGHGMSLGDAMLRSLAGRFDPAPVAAAIERQLDAFEAQWKAAPDHVDGHQHVHQFAGIRAPLLDALDRRYGAGRGPYLRISRPMGPAAGIKGRVVAAMGAAALQRELRRRGRPGAAPLLGMYGFDGSAADYAGLAQRWLQDAPAGAVLMCHPATGSTGDDPIGPARLREFEFWAGDAASGCLARANAVPARGPAPAPDPTVR
jgi:predicted glycoside hydrolase/deacetylase ChbG (UPF0249 family)